MHLICFTKFGGNHCRDMGKVLLMRKVKHGGGKWGMPGGSQDSKDVDSLATAEREFRSEIGEPPQHEVKGQILVRRCLALPDAYLQM